MIGIGNEPSLPQTSSLRHYCISPSLVVASYQEVNAFRSNWIGQECWQNCESRAAKTQGTVVLELIESLNAEQARNGSMTASTTLRPGESHLLCIRPGCEPEKASLKRIFSPQNRFSNRILVLY